MNAEFKLKLEGALLEAGLPTDPAKIINKIFMFRNHRGEAFLGMTTGITLDRQGLKILIAPLNIWGGAVNNVHYDNYGRVPDGWTVDVDTSGGGYEGETYSGGDFKILPSA